MRLAASLIGALLACASASAGANGSSWQEDTRGNNALQQGPLALSADGRWRVHVDAADVMHRVNLADPKQAASIALPTHVHALAASRTAQKVALVTDGGCIALVDFGSGATPAPRVSWQTDVATTWQDMLPNGCLGDRRPEAVDAIALSTDGHLLATGREVVDLEAHRLVATLPRAHERTALVRFVAHDTRLLTAGHEIVEGDTGGIGIDRLVMAVWELKSGELLSLFDERRELQLPIAQLVDLPVGSASVYSVSQSPQDGPDQEGPADLTGWRVDGCAAPVPPRRVPIQHWTSLAVDPAGRWIAGTRPHFFESEDAANRSPITDDLVVLDTATGRTLLVREFPHALRGLVASADGTQLFALATPSYDYGRTTPKTPASRLPVGQVLTIAIPDVVAAAPTIASVTAMPCPVPREAPHARELARDGHAQRLLWSQPLVDLPAIRSSCDYACGPLMVMHDGSLWVDNGGTAVQFDNATGKLLRTVPTPRSDKVTSVPLRAADGWFNAQGDTLSWRPIDGTAARRVIDRRPGWEIVFLRAQGDAVLAAWVRKSTAPPPADGTVPPPRPATYVFYDAQGRRLSESTKGTEDVEGEEEPGSAYALGAFEPPWAPACRDAAGPRTTGFDWRLERFGSIVAWACGPAAGDARMALWSDVDIRPKPQADTDVTARQVVAQDGAIGVIQDKTSVRVFDAATRREVGRIPLAFDLRLDAVAIDASHGQLLVVTSRRSADDTWHETLQAYQLRP